MNIKEKTNSYIAILTLAENIACTRCNVMVDFIYIGLVELPGTQSKQTLQNKTFYHTAGFDETTFRTEILPF